jgi:hypothetical protein
MVQAADRRRLGATSTPPSLPAPGWRRDLVGNPPQILIERAPAGALFDGAPDAARLRPPDRPAAVMVLAPALGLAIWVLLLALFILIS